MRRCAERFGAQCIVVAIDAKRVAGSGEEGRPPAWEVYVHGGRTPTGIDALAWAVRAAELGAGEFMLTSMDRDGTLRRLRPRADARRGPRRRHPGDRLRRRGHARAPRRRPHERRGRRGAGRQHLPLRHVLDRRDQGVSGGARHPGARRGRGAAGAPGRAPRATRPPGDGRRCLARPRIDLAALGAADAAALEERIAPRASSASRPTRSTASAGRSRPRSPTRWWRPRAATPASRCRSSSRRSAAAGGRRRAGAGAARAPAGACSRGRSRCCCRTRPAGTSRRRGRPARPSAGRPSPRSACACRRGRRRRACLAGLRRPLVASSANPQRRAAAGRLDEVDAALLAQLRPRPRRRPRERPGLDRRRLEPVRRDRPLAPSLRAGAAGGDGARIACPRWAAAAERPARGPGSRASRD